MSTKQQTLKAPISFSGKGAPHGRQGNHDRQSRRSRHGDRIPPHRPRRATHNTRTLRLRRRHFARHDHRERRPPRKHHRTYHVGALDAGRGQRRDRHRRPRDPHHGRFGLRLCQGHHRNGRRRPGRRTQILPRDRKDGLHDPREGRGHHPLSRRRVFGLGARGLQLEGHRQPVRHLQPGDNYAEKISPCRTFVFLHELEPLIK